MTSLRDDIAQAIHDALGVRTGPQGVRSYPKPWEEKAADAALGVVEARLREHDAQQRQRIEALRSPYETWQPQGRVLDAVLEALGGSE